MKMMMRGARALLAVGLGVALVPAVADARPKHGVFGKINGKKFKARNNGRSDDNCVYGTYAAGRLTLTAGECSGKRKKMPKKDFAQVLFRCDDTNPPKTPPYEATCAVAVYVEARVKGDQATDEKAWLSSVTMVPGTDGLPVRQTGVTLRVASFDGTVVKGSFSGVFDVPQMAGLSTVPIDKEVVFSIPVTLP
jgi:hypothetical protein